VDELSFTVARGETFALLGPNGAGKTTTIEILEGYRSADGGSVRVLGLDPRRDAARLKPRIGIMLQQGGVYPQIRPLEALRLFAAFYPSPADPEELLALVGLRAAVRTPYRRLSGGEQRRLALGLALVGRPEIVFLDEPTTGMDPQARQATWEVVRSLRAGGATVLLTTHYLEEAERLADRVAIIRQGRLIALGSPAELTRAAGREVRFSAPPGLDVAALGARLGAPVREERPGSYVVVAEPTPALLAELTAGLRDAGALLTELRVARRTLEETFLALTAGAVDARPGEGAR
jgi:ABC-2 type transport system ATP-binding protein